MNWEVPTMQSVTSYFNASLFRGSLRRAWPLWFGYTLVWFMILPLPLLNELADRRILGNSTVQDVSEYILARVPTAGSPWRAFSAFSSP